MQKVIQTNVKKIFESEGLLNLEPSAKALKEMSISRDRFVQLLENKQKNPITLHELACIKGWIYHVLEANSNKNLRKNH